MGRWKYEKVLLGCLLLIVLLAGCSVRSADELYALPRQSDIYDNLQQAIDQVMVNGAAYSGPQTGSNQQAVQLADLDGDGQDEAVVFMKTTGDKPLKAYIFDREDDMFRNTAVIEGDGSEFDAVEYAQLDGEPGLEILVGRRLSDQIVHSLGAYAYRQGRHVELMNANYSEFRVTDLNCDDCRDVFILRTEANERGGVAEIYHYKNGLMQRDQEANLSVGAKQVKRILTGYVAQGIPAVFVASAYEEDTVITDIFAYVGQNFCNVAVHADSGFSAQTVRSYHVFATDIDEDGVIELPMPNVLPSATAGEGTFWSIDWYNLLPDGGRSMKLSTYHDYSAGWYLVLPAQWYDQLSVTKGNEVAGVLGTIFSKWNGYGHATEEIITIYGFTGEDRVALAQADGRVLLAEKGEVAYSAQIGTCSFALDLTIEDMQSMFRFIYQDWNSGET